MRKADIVSLIGVALLILVASVSVYVGSDYHQPELTLASLVDSVLNIGVGSSESGSGRKSKSAFKEKAPEKEPDTKTESKPAPKPEKTEAVSKNKEPVPAKPLIVEEEETF